MDLVAFNRMNLAISSCLTEKCFELSTSNIMNIQRIVIIQANPILMPFNIGLKTRALSMLMPADFLANEIKHKKAE